MQVAIFAHEVKSSALRLATEMIGYLREAGHRTVVSPVMVPLLELQADEVLPLENWQYDKIHLVVVLGGDGTLLNASKKLVPTGIPLLGVNLGRLGFLTELEQNELWQEFPRILHGEYLIERRRLLSAVVERDQATIGEYQALNDIVVSKGAVARMLRLHVHVNGQLLGSWPGDGVIVASSTGSTAYSLAAGGPIIAPDLDICLITPICPHTLQARPFVISENKEVTVRIDGESRQAYLTSDGQEGMPLEAGDQVRIRLSQVSVPLVRRSSYSFYSVLHRKLTARQQENG